MPDGSSTAHLYRPKLVTVLDEGYGPAAFRRDITAALTVAVVALPLSMAIAVASGVGPSAAFTLPSSVDFWCRRWEEAGFKLAARPVRS
jgi:hypothetical protein